MREPRTGAMRAIAWPPLRHRSSERRYESPGPSPIPDREERQDHVPGGGHSNALYPRTF